jgi:sugar porter (SP) family MFS transporter
MFHLHASFSYDLLTCPRFIAGLGLGAATMVTPTYVSECAPRGLRGALTGLYQLFETIGAMLAFWISYGSLLHIKGEGMWAVPLAFQAFPAILLVIGMCFCSETPRFLAKKDNWEQATAVLARTRNLPAEHPYVQAELTEMRAQLEEERRLIGGSGWGDLFKEMVTVPSNRKRALISFLLMVCQQLTGTNAVNFYAPLIFQSLGLKGNAVSLLATGVYGITKVIGCSLFLLFMADSLGRKKSLMVSATSMGIAMFYLGFFVRFDPPVAGAPVPPAGYVALVMVYIFAICFQLGWGPVCWIYVSEIPTARLRGINVALAASTQWLFNFAVARATPPMLANVGGKSGYGTYFIFGSFCFAMCIFVLVFIPETKGVSLERMDELFGKGGAGKLDVEDVGDAARAGSEWDKKVPVEHVEEVRR